MNQQKSDYPEFVYALEERIGEPSLFCGRKQEMDMLLKWASGIPRKMSKSRALLGRRKTGKTAIMQRLFNILWNQNDRVIPFYFEVLDQDMWLLDFCDRYYRTFISQYLSFMLRIPLDKDNTPWKWNQLEDLLTQIRNDDILRNIAAFKECTEKEQVHEAMMDAFGTPARFTGYDDVFFLVMIDEIQYMTKYIYHDKACTNVFRNLPGGFHGLVELKSAPMLVSGSYVGWMTQMMHEMFVGGRLKRTPISPKLMFAEGMEAVYAYAKHHGIGLTEKAALLINALTQSDPFYISILFGSDHPEKYLSEPDGVIRTLTYEITYRDSELHNTWSEYLDSAIRRVNDICGKKVLLYLSKERHKECTRDEIREHLGWAPERDRELEEKLRTFEYAGLITRGSSDFHYRGIPDDILDLIFRERYQYETEAVRPDANSELAGRIRYLEGSLSELKGRMLELIVWRELNKCAKEGRTIKNFAKRMRKISDDKFADKIGEMAKFCGKSRFARVWMNYYVQIPQTGISEADVLAEGEDEESCWALIFETKNRDERNPPTMNEARLFAEKADRVRQVSEQTGKRVRFVCPVYFSAKGFEEDIEAWMHSRGILTTDMETWEG